VVQDDVSVVFRSLGWYIGVMLGTYLFHGFVLLPILFTILTRKLPFEFLKNITEAIVTAFGTASRFEAFYDDYLKYIYEYLLTLSI